MTKDDIIRMAREAGFRFSDEEGPLMADHAEWQRQLFERFAALVAAQERESYEHTLALQQQSYEREIKIEVEAEREACIDDCNAEARDDGTAQRIIERIRARGQA